MTIDKNQSKSYVYCDSTWLRDRILSIHPSTDGLFPHEIAMLVYTGLGQYTTKKRHYSGVWRFQFGIVSPDGLLFSLVSRGFVRECEDSELIEHLKINEIRKILKTKGLKSGRTKQDAIAIVKGNFSDKEISSLCGFKYYVLTEKGKSALNSQPKEIIVTPTRIWELFKEDYSKPLLRENQIQMIDTTEYTLYVGSDFTGELYLSASYTQVVLYQKHFFDEFVTLNVFIKDEIFLKISEVSKIFLLPKIRKLIIGKNASEELTCCVCYDLEKKEEIFQELIDSELLYSPTTPVRQQTLSNLSLYNTGIVDDKKVYYYVSTTDGISEAIVKQYLSRSANIQKIVSLLHDDYSNNYCISVDKEDTTSQRLIMYMIVTHSLSSPAIMGSSIYEALRMMLLSSDKKTIQALLDNESLTYDVSKNAAKVLCEELSKDFDFVLTRFLARYPARAISYEPYKFYSCKNQYEKDPVFSYVIYNREKCDSLFQELLLRLKEEGVISPRWISEFNLYLLVKSRYEDTIYQWRTSWLGPQSIDVFIPGLQIGIEYQGKQHYEPVEIFGGVKGYSETIERDNKKKQLCEDNGIVLLEWPYSLEISTKNLDDMLRLALK